MRQRNTRGALLALASAAGLWAWQNRDKIGSMINQQKSRMQGSAPSSFETPATGATRRFDGTLDGNQFDNTERPKYDASI